MTSCTKTVEVGQDEIGLVFSNWDGESYATFYEPGTYEIPSYKGFTAAKIIEKTRIIKFNRIVNKDTLELHIKVSFKPIPQKNFDLYDTLGLDYDKNFVQQLLTTQTSELGEFKGTDNELIEQLRHGLEKDKTFKRYLRLTSFEVIDE